jgi:signal peptidase
MEIVFLTTKKGRNMDNIVAVENGYERITNNYRNREEDIQANSWHKFLTVVGTVMTVILLPILIINCTLIIRSMTKRTELPSIAGYIPFIVLTDSMYSEIQSGDLVICHTIEAEEIKLGDIIAFFDPAGNGSSVVTHRVIDITSMDGETAFQTKGDASNVADASLVPASNLVGIYQMRLAGVGRVAMFMQTTTGLIVCVVIPLILLIAYDVTRHRIYERKRQAETAALLAELEELRSEK